MPPAGFEPAIPAGERPQIHALHRAATGIDFHFYYYLQFHVSFQSVIWTKQATELGKGAIEDAQKRENVDPVTLLTL